MNTEYFQNLTVLNKLEKEHKMAYKKAGGKGKAKLSAKQMKLPKALREKILKANRKGK
jgi:hypothetical protein